VSERLPAERLDFAREVIRDARRPPPAPVPLPWILFPLLGLLLLVGVAFAEPLRELFIERVVFPLHSWANEAGGEAAAPSAGVSPPPARSVGVAGAPQGDLVVGPVRAQDLSP